MLTLDIPRKYDSFWLNYTRVSPNTSQEHGRSSTYTVEVYQVHLLQVGFAGK